MLIPIPNVHLGMGLATAAVSLPLMLRWVPRNHLYGVRFREAFISDRNWYEVNAYGGRLLFAFGLFLAAFGRFARGLAPPPSSLGAPLFLLAPLLALVPVLALIKARARRLPDR